MILQTLCTSCNKPIKIKTYAQTRPDLEMDKGEVMQLNCSNCGSNQNTHVNDVEAIVSQEMVLFGILISLFVEYISLLFAADIGNIPST